MATKKTEFDILEMLNQESLNQATQSRRTIHISKLIPHERNTYSMVEIPELADTIEDFGLMHEILVKPIGDGTFTIVSGERRYRAVKLLVEERGRTDLEEVDCGVLSGDEDPIITELKLHFANTSARELSEYDKLQAVESYRRLIAEAKEKGITIKGTIKALVAGQMGMGETQAGKYLSISNKADEEIKEALKKGEITVEKAYAETQEKDKDKKASTKKSKKTKGKAITKKKDAIKEIHNWTSSMATELKRQVKVVSIGEYEGAPGTYNTITVIQVEEGDLLEKMEVAISRDHIGDVLKLLGQHTDSYVLDGKKHYRFAVTRIFNNIFAVGETAATKG